VAAGGDLFAILSQGTQSLAAHRAATATASHNLQNANTPGFARQRAELTTVVPPDDTGHGNIGRGVSLLQVTQARDKFVEHQMPVAHADQAESLAESETLQALTALDPDSENGLAASLGHFYATMRGLSQNPGDRGLRQALLGSAQALASAFNRTDTAIETARDGVDSKVEALVLEVNRATAAIADLNRAVRRGYASGSIPNDMLDARQREIDKVAALTGARPVETGNYAISMVLPGGNSLVHEFNAGVLKATPMPGNNGHYGLTLTPAGSSIPLTLVNQNLGGQMGGLLSARDSGLGTARTGLDQLAFDFITAINTVHSAGYGLDGVTGRDLFTTPASADGAASSMVVDPTVVADIEAIAAASAAGVPGDSTNLLALIATENQGLTGGTNAGETLGKITATYGASAARASARNEQDRNLLQSLENLRESTSGVSIDEELVSLTKSQRAFEAVMKVITTSDKMLEVLMNLR
jgi:flagellar hook-associated protein 1